MKLDRFLSEHIDEILAEWEAFSMALVPAATGSGMALRDHARGMLQAIALDIETSQTPEQQYQKSRGNAPHGGGGVQSAAFSHGGHRQASDFSLLQLCAEFRALRATVLRLWLPRLGEMTQEISDQMVRFNEAIDQALAESLVEFSRTVESWRNVFLGALGHDLRGPLTAVVATADLLKDSTQGTPHARQAERILSGGLQLSRLVDGLLDYSKSTLGAGMPLHRIACDLGEAVAAELDLLLAALPEAPLRLQVQGATHGYFDDARIREAVHNLVTNAAKYGQRAAPIDVALTGDARSVRIAVSNAGQPLSSDALHALFDPLRRGSLPAHKGEHASLGLGLFLVREIAIAHGGDVAAHVDEGVTTFVIHLPRGDTRAA